MTEPLTPADCNLTDWPAMLLDVVRLRDSGLASDEEPAACWAAVLLWAASWHQVPAASIPNNDMWIAKHAGYAQRGKIDREWARVRPGALRNFVECADGRLYHPVVAEKALECWLDKLAGQLSSGAGNAKRWKIAFDPAPIEHQMQVARELLTRLNPQSRSLRKRRTSGATPQSLPDPDGTPDNIPPGSQEKDKGKRTEDSSEPKGSGAADAPPPVDKSTGTAETADPRRREAWRQCGLWLVANGMAEATARELMGKLAKDYPAVAVDACLEAPKQAVTPNAQAWLVAVAQRMAGERSKSPPKAYPSAEETQAEDRRRQAAFDAANTPEERERTQRLLQEWRASRAARQQPEETTT